MGLCAIEWCLGDALKRFSFSRLFKSICVFFGNISGKCGVCPGLGGNIPERPGYGPKPGGKKGGGVRNIRNGFGGVFMAAATLFARDDPRWLSVSAPPGRIEGWWPPALDFGAKCCRGCGVNGVESQNRLCLDKDVPVLKLWPHLLQWICIRQSACIRLCLQRFENCVYAFRQTSHWKGFTDEWMCVCCLRPDEVANVFPHSGQAWLRAPTWCVRMCRWRFDGSVKTCKKWDTKQKMKN